MIVPAPTANWRQRIGGRFGRNCLRSDISNAMRDFKDQSSVVIETVQFQQTAQVESGNRR